VQTVNISSQSFLAIVRLLHWVDRTISYGDAKTQNITTLADTPQTVADGFRSAGQSIMQGFSTAIDGVVRMPISAFHNNGFLSGIATFTRNIPGVVIRPVVGVGDAFVKVMFSIRNSMDPTLQYRESEPFIAKDATLGQTDSSVQSDHSSTESSSTGHSSTESSSSETKK